jgi:hypothetical protein
MSFRAGFLIVAAADVLHVSFWPMLVLLIGYGVCAEIDQWWATKKRATVLKALDAAVDDEIFGWKPDPERPDWEEKGDFGRIRLPEKDQIVVTRIAEILRKSPRP